MPFVIKQLFSEKKQSAFLFLIHELGYTEKEAQRLIAKGRLFVDGEPMCNASGTVKGAFEFICFEPITRGLHPTFQTDEFAAFDKPSGVLIHPQNRFTPYSLVDEIKYHFGRDANIAHRLDQETSGLVLAAKDKQSERELKMMFENRQMKKRYLAMVHGELTETLDIKAPLLRRFDESAIVRMVVKVDEAGKHSETYVTPLRYFPEYDTTLVEARPLTGRQHQIRVHLFHVKHPIVGDPIYGQSEQDAIRYLEREISPEERCAKSGSDRLLLHASELDFHYKGKRYVIHSKDDFAGDAIETIKQCRKSFSAVMPEKPSS
jgi:23S rRNA pseudouridine1911/1915/1917 synthase